VQAAADALARGDRKLQYLLLLRIIGLGGGGQEDCSVSSTDFIRNSRLGTGPRLDDR